MHKRILVVDDNHDAADTLARVVESLGCEAKAVYDGRQAVEEIASFQPAMALIDIGMPGLDGCQTVALIRKQRVSDHPVFVAVTGWLRQEDKWEAYDSGFDFYVPKPISRETLQALIGMLEITCENSVSPDAVAAPER